jgi:hypothetical protein
MTDQSKLNLIWAETGGVTDPGDLKYETGWIAEVPTFQNFNFVLQNATLNALSLCEKGVYGWETTINYEVGSKAKGGTSGKYYTSIAAHTGQDPDLDVSNNYWVLGSSFGDGTSLQVQHGLLVKDVNVRASSTTWAGSDITLINSSALVQYNTSNGTVKNWLMGNISGELACVDVGTVGTADDRAIGLNEAGTYRLFHEGHPPTQGEVAGTFPDAPADGKIYGRRNNGWIVVTATTVSTAPPPALSGAGAGWYNLDDGQTYTDVEDGDSAQWASASPPIMPQSQSSATAFNNAISPNIDGTNAQDAIDELAAQVAGLQAQLALLLLP